VAMKELAVAVAVAPDNLAIVLVAWFVAQLNRPKISWKPEHKLSVVDVGFVHSLPTPYHLVRIETYQKFSLCIPPSQKATPCIIHCHLILNSLWLVWRPEEVFFEATKLLLSACLTASAMASAAAMRLR